jgi:hypothetical protein
MNAVIGYQRLADNQAGWAAVIDGCELGAIGAGCVLILDLGMHGRSMRFAQRGKIRWNGTSPDAALAAVEAYPNVVHRNGVAVDVVDHGVIDIVHSAVVEEMTGVPIASLVAGAPVAIAVVDAAVEADVGPPIAVEESIMAAYRTPVAGCPERTLVGRLNPNAGHPVIAG